MEEDQFILTLEEKYYPLYVPDKALEDKYQFKTLKWYWRWLGFKNVFRAIVLDIPKHEGKKWTYTLRFVQKEKYWLFIKYKTIKYNYE